MFGVAIRTLGTLLLVVGLVILVLMADRGFNPFGVLAVTACFVLGIAAHVTAPRGGE